MNAFCEKQILIKPILNQEILVKPIRIFIYLEEHRR